MQTEKLDAKGHGKLRFGIDIALTLLFLATIFYFLISTIAFEQGLFGRAFYMRYLSQYLEDSDDYTPMELVQASIDSLDHFISTQLHGTNFLGQVNSTFQYALGKRLVSTGGTQMIRLNSGHLYDIQTEMSMEPGRDDVLAMRAIVPEDIPFLFVYEHPTLYDEASQMPAGYDFLDYGIQEADEITGLLRDAGVDVMDSREVLNASGVPLDECLLYTDQHWSTRAAMLMAQAIAEKTEAVTGLDLPTERLDIDQFETEVREKIFLGKYGQRVGTLVIDPDDITIYRPKYDTHMRVRTSLHGELSEREGSFNETLQRKGALTPAAGKSWNTVGYQIYGLIEDYDIIENADGADCTILLLKDSFSAPIGRFLSLVAKNVYSVDMRSYYAESLSELIQECDPDIVVVAYSLQMLREEQYEFD